MSITLLQRGGIALAVLLLLAAAVPDSATAAPPDDPDRVVRTYEVDGATVLQNPERGMFYDTGEVAQITQSRARGWRNDGLSVVHMSIDIGAYVTAPLTDAELAAETAVLQTAFGYLRTEGLKAIVRFTYSPKGTQTCLAGASPSIDSDAPLAVILAHITQFAPSMAANEDVIANFEAGFLGVFGEWHCSTYSSVGSSPVPNDNRVDPAAQAAVMQAMQAEFPVRQIAMRYPDDILARYPATYASPISRIGNHQDCYSSKGASDEGTWTPGSEAAQKADMGALGLDHVVTATVCALPVRATCDVAVAEMSEMHFTYVQEDFFRPALQTFGQPTTPGQPATGCWDEIDRRLGYRFTLLSSDLPSRLVPGSTVPVQITARNDGWSSPYNDRPVFLVLRDTKRTVTLPLVADPTVWRAGEVVTISDSITVPADLAAGRYDVALWLPDPSLSLQRSPAYAVQFANTGVWNAASGDNVLATGVTVGAASTAPPRPPRLAESGGADSARVASLAGAASLIAGVALLATRTRRRPQGRRDQSGRTGR